MKILLAVLVLLTAITIGLGTGARGARKNQIASTGFFLLIVIGIIGFMNFGWKWAVALFGGAWLLGSILGLFLNKKYGGLDDIDNAIAGGARAKRKLLKNIRKGR